MAAMVSREAVGGLLGARDFSSAGNLPLPYADRLPTDAEAQR